MLCIPYQMKCSDVGWNGAVGNLNGVKPNERVAKCSWVKLKWKKWSGVMVLLTGFLSLLENI